MAEASESRVRILGLKVVARAQDGNSDHGLIAVFDVRVPPFVLFSARLYRRRNGTLTVAMPEAERADGNSSGIRIEDDELREQILQAACGVARLLGANVSPGPVLSHGFSEAGARLIDPAHKA